MEEILTHQQQPAHDVHRHTHPGLFFPTRLPVTQHAGQHWNTRAPGQSPSEPALQPPSSTSLSFQEPQLEGEAADQGGSFEVGHDAIDSNASDETQEEGLQRLEELELEATSEGVTMSGAFKSRYMVCFGAWLQCDVLYGCDRSRYCKGMHLLQMKLH